ncbi:MAG: IS21 family transposase [Planctomycetota bacterium]|nr:MAG: IS21 family transposase [Planctomycetota bacterium]
MLLRHYLERGLTKAEVARELGVSRRTVYNWIETGQLDRELDDLPVRYSPRPPVARKLDSFRGIIEARLNEFPRLTATRLFDEIHAAGYAGGYTQLKEYVRQVRPTPPADPIVRFETPPGHQGQVDFAEFRLPWGKRYALVVVLAHSRLLWLHFYERQTMAVLMRGLEEAFAFFGGVPAELLFDQMKAVIIDDERTSGGQLLENPEFVRFAAHWGFRIRACRPYRAKTKGKVERPIGYVRQSFFYARTFLNDVDLNAQALFWLGHTANVRRHRTTGEGPRLRFERDERILLKTLAPRPYRTLIPATTASTGPSPRSSFLTVERRSLASYDRLAGVTR